MRTYSVRLPDLPHDPLLISRNGFLPPCLQALDSGARLEGCAASVHEAGFGGLTVGAGLFTGPTGIEIRNRHTVLTRRLGARRLGDQRTSDGQASGAHLGAYRRSGLVISREQGLCYDAGFAVPVLMS